MRETARVFAAGCPRGQTTSTTQPISAKAIANSAVEGNGHVATNSILGFINCLKNSQELIYDYRYQGDKQKGEIKLSLHEIRVIPFTQRALQFCSIQFLAASVADSRIIFNGSFGQLLKDIHMDTAATRQDFSQSKGRAEIWAKRDSFEMGNAG